MKGVILAAGKGEKFMPFSYYRPKPMFPVANRPLLEYTIERLVEEGIKEIGIVVGHRQGRIKSYFKDGKNFGCRITYINQADISGTGQALLEARQWVGDEDFIVIYGDVYFGKEVIKKLKEKIGKSKTGVAAIEDGEGRYGIAVEVKDNFIINYHWKDPHYKDYPLLSGIYCFKKEIWKYLQFLPDITEETGNGIFPLQEKELGSICKVLAEEGKPLIGVKIGKTIDMDLPWQPLEIFECVVKEMEKELKKKVVEEGARIEEGAEIEGNIYLGKNSVIKKNVMIKGPVWIGENTVILEGSQILPYTVIGNDCIIGPHCRIWGSIGNKCRITHCAEFEGIVLDESYLVHYCEMAGIFGERSEIGAGTMVGTRRFDDRPNQVIINGVKYEAGKFSGVLFGDYSRTGIGAMLMPGRIIGPSSIVGPGVILMKNLEPFKMVLAKQEQEEIPWKQNIYDK